MDKTKTAIAVFNKLAIVYQDKFMDVRLYGETFDFFCNYIDKKNAEIFEIACGPGNITNYLLKKRPDFKLTGIDLAPKMIELAKINNPTADFQLMDCRDIGTIKKQYDGIMCGFCLPYLSKEDAIKLIRDASKLLKPKGLLYISTMEGDYAKSGYEKGSTGEEIYMHYHEAGYLTAALRENHFNILKTERKENPNKEGIKLTDLIIISEKHSSS